MQSAAIHSQASLAIADFLSDLRRSSPHLAAAMEFWMRQISPDGDPACHFTHPRMFPVLQLPQWLAATLPIAPDPQFHLGLTVSSICGYYHIRMIDNIMDADLAVAPGALPALGVFSARFQAAYQRFFPADHPFWQHFHKLWQESCENAARDAQSGDIDCTWFHNVSSRKFCAAGIPLVAACYRYDRPDLIAPWLQFTDAFARWSQMLDDLLDWHTDFSQQRSTYFLCEGARTKMASDSLQQWVISEGFAWGVATLQEWMLALRSQARSLGSQDLESYLSKRATLLVQQAADIQEGFVALTELASVLEFVPADISQESLRNSPPNLYNAHHDSKRHRKGETNEIRGTGQQGDQRAWFLQPVEGQSGEGIAKRGSKS
jgi:hypothetical protein